MQAEGKIAESEGPPQEAGADEKAEGSSADPTDSNQPPAEGEADNANTEAKDEEAEVKDEEMEEGDDKDEVKDEEEVDEEMIDEENNGEMEDEEMAEERDELDAKEEDGEDETAGVDGEIDGEGAGTQRVDDAAQGEAKDDAAQEEPKELPKAPEVPKELEEDDGDDQREKVERRVVAWSSTDATMNAILGADGHLIMPITDAGCQYLDTGVRATIGLKAGRYFFEATIIENLVRQANIGMGTTQFCRIGVSLAESSLFMGYSKDNVCFDSHGFFWHNGKSTQATAAFGRGATLGLLVNLDASSKNANTLSLFRNGHRAGPPQALPEAFLGKVIYPTITFKGMTLHANLGPLARAPLPFKCRMVQDAAADDVEIKPQPPQQETCEVIFPVGLPGEGAFDYIDFFSKSHPDYMELSDRKILDWGYNSGLHANYNAAHSRDKPETKMGLPTGMDGNAMRALLTGLAPFVRRNFIVMELRGNLLEAERRKRLQHWGASHKKVALVLIGEPTADYKEWVHSLILSDKQKMMEMMKMAKLKQESVSSPQKSQRSEAKVEEGKKDDGNDTETQNESKSLSPEKLPQDSDKAKDEQINDDETSKDPVNTAEDSTKEQPDVGTHDGENKEGEEETKEAPVELTEEEKKAWHRKNVVPDMAEGVIATNYVSFSLPTEDEGFDEIRFVWQPKEESTTYMQNWIRQQKQTQFATNLQPSAAFKGAYETWNKLLLGWKQTQMDSKAKADKSKTEKKPNDAGDDTKEEEPEQPEEEEPEKTEEEKRRIFEDIDIETIEDIANVEGTPLFQYFAYEDWVLLRLRYELHLLIHAYREDLNDPDRPSFKQSHLTYVYAKYFQKQIALKTFAVSTVKDLVELIEDTIGIMEETDMLQTLLPKDTPPEKFVKLTEEHRRDRARRVDAGDESAALNFQMPNEVKLQQAQSSQQWPQGKGGCAPMGHLGKGVWTPAAMQSFMAQANPASMQGQMQAFMGIMGQAPPALQAMMSQGMANHGMWRPQAPSPAASPAPPSAPSNPLLNVMKRLGEQQKGKAPQVPAPPAKPFNMPKLVTPPPGNWGPAPKVGQPAPTVGQPAPKVGQKKPRPPSHPPTHSAKAMPSKRQAGSSGSSRDASRSWDANKNQDYNKKDSWDKSKGGSWDAKSWDAQKKDSWDSSSKTTVPYRHEARPSMAPAPAPPPPPPGAYPHPGSYDARYISHGQSHGQHHGQSHSQSHGQSHEKGGAPSSKRRKKGK